MAVPSPKAEPLMNMLAELTTTNITKEENPRTMDEHAKVAASAELLCIKHDIYEESTTLCIASSYL